MKQRFEKINEFFAAGLYEQQDASPFIRFSRAIRRYLEKRELPDYNGEPLYPCGSFATDFCVKYDYSYTVGVNWGKLEQKDKELAKTLKEELSAYHWDIPQEHRVGGQMYTHSFANFRRLVREGLNSYQKRVEKVKNDDIRNGLLDVLAGIKAFHSRALALLKEDYGNSKLYKALEKVPFMPAETLYEAIVCWNFIYYMDGCDDIGRLDEDLIDFYNGEDMTEVFKCLFLNVDANNGWSGCLGPNYNPLTIQCIRACKGLRRPSLELRVTQDMPQKIWDEAVSAVKEGGGSPSFYNEEEYQKILEKLFPHIPAEDRMRFCGGGCTETMLTGLCNVGSLDAGVNVALVFERFMQSELAKAESFDGFYKSFIKNCSQEIDKVLNEVSEAQKLRAKYRPQPMRTLLIDDCIEKELDFNNGGARYCWSVINLAGLINVIDSMLTIRKVVFENKEMSGAELLEYINAGNSFLNREDIARHGTDSDEANEMAKSLTEDICAIFDGKIPYLGGKFLPSSIQFNTYAEAGAMVGATPDGRQKGEPLCDSIGAIHGNDKLGATALLNSAASLCQSKLSGTPVLNLKINKTQIEKCLKPLIKGYFKKGGMQIQVTCASLEDMLDAQKNPEKHSNLIVRIGGYSEYFTRLSPELQKAVIERTVHGM